MLRDLQLKAVYRSEEDNLLTDFYIPALSNARIYQRAVGYFSAAMLSYAAQGISALVENDGKIQLIFGGELDEDEAMAIENGYGVREVTERLGIRYLEVLESVAESLCHHRLETLSWLVATGRLDLKVALRRKGMYHEKIGIIRDADDDAIVFQGSANETVSALLPDYNFESINVFQCWRKEFSDHFIPYIEGFDRLWTDKAKHTKVLDFPEAAKKRLITIAKRGRFLKPEVEIQMVNDLLDPNDAPVMTASQPIVPKILNGQPFEIRLHQRNALNEWRARSLRGIFAHATGSGKTITAIYGATRLFEAVKRLALVIAVPYQNLADQWVSILSHFNIFATKCYGNRKSWIDTFSDQVDSFEAGALPFVCAVVVNRTLQSKDFQSLLARIPGDALLFVGDECHHHTGATLSSSLPSHARMRLGLSATPEHYIDQQATNRLIQYYGEIASTFTLADALEASVVTPYDYFVWPVSLTKNESEAYIKLSKQISALAAQDGQDEEADDSELKKLLMRRARLLGSAIEKLDALKKLLLGKPTKALTLFYCGDGSTDNDESGEDIRDVERITSLLYSLGWNCAQFTARETRDVRRRLLSAFEVTAIDALVAIKCLDEGIDVPACRTAYLLASARNPKQFIQRRGRILRRAPGKELATVHDFLVRLPPDLIEESPYERRLVAAELERVAEFGRLARNPSDSRRTLLPLLKEYDLAHLLI